MTLVKHNIKNFDNIFDELLNTFPANWGRDMNFSIPPVNIHETNDAYHLELIAPGLKKDAFKIKLTTAKGKERNYFIDATTYYLVKETFMSNRGGQRGGSGGSGGTPPAGPTEVTVTFDNFQKTPEGFVFPFTISTSGMGAKQNLEKIEVNPAVDEASLMEGIKK